MHKKFLTLIIAVFMIFSSTIVSAAENKELVLLDSDMDDLFDDGVAMMILAQSPKVKLLGITIATGNTWTQDGAASAIRQLEGLGLHDIPVAMGDTPSNIRKRLKNLDKEFEQYGRGFDMYIGAASYKEPSDWLTAYRNRYDSEPFLAPIDENAVDFIIRTIKEHPNQVTIVEISPQTNLAAAIKRAPEIVPLVKRVVYMAGAFFKEGNITPAAEFNVWFDPTSAKRVIRAPFQEQIFVPLDVCDKISLTRAEFQDLKNRIKSPLFLDMVNRIEETERMFAGSNSTGIWDSLAAAIVVDPSIITEEITMPVDVNDVLSPSYGETLAYRRAPKDTQNARIVLEMNQDEVINMIQQVFDNL